MVGVQFTRRMRAIRSRDKVAVIGIAVGAALAAKLFHHASVERPPHRRGAGQAQAAPPPPPPPHASSRSTAPVLQRLYQAARVAFARLQLHHGATQSSSLPRNFSQRERCSRQRSYACCLAALA
ncbi:hypothetical protein EYR05_00520 [Xanthomonas oryzae pv. oryzae]|nr:hypothetical protein EYR05_00520 [Xanthomonas oryzae pv. oryzae]